MTNVFFSIPLAGKRDEAGWGISCRLLGHTLASVLNQTDPRFEVVITGHERPALPELDDPRVTFLSASFEKPEPAQYRVDKRRKRERNALHVKSRGGGYIVFLDADDLVSRRLVEHVRFVDDPNGYIVDEGYVLDHAAGILARYEEFDRQCGSCAVIHCPAEEIDPSGAGYAMSFYGRSTGHPLWRGMAEAAGRPLRPVPFPAMVYVVNTSQNISVSKGEARVADRLLKIRKQQVPLTPEIAAEFSLAGLAPVAPSPAEASLRGRLARLGRRLRAGL